MTYKQKYYYMVKVINSCNTTEQLDNCREWIRNKGLNMDDYFILSGFINRGIIF